MDVGVAEAESGKLRKKASYRSALWQTKSGLCPLDIYYGVTYLPKIHRYQTCKQKRVRLIMKIHLAKFWVSIVPGTIVGKSLVKPM